MFFCVVEDDTYAIKPMNCPGAILIYKTRPHSYRELPLRLSEFGRVHRFELSGVLMGLFRARAFTIDDGHIFCTEDQIEKEVFTTIEMIYKVLGAFGFTDIKVKLATKPDNAMGSDEYWEKAIGGLRNALDASGKPYEICEGEGAFYGPKIEFHFEDSMGRSWQCSTVQLDFFLPQNFDLHYIGSDGTKKRPVMIHRAIYGSFERFFGILLEHYKGKLPFWIAPIQARVLTITDEQKEYARDIVSALAEHNIRVELDESSDQISGQIKRAQLDRIPWMVVIGKKEVENSTITLRHLDGKQEFGVTLDILISQAAELNQR
jgi:threonyl-tRNA synthetase